MPTARVSAITTEDISAAAKRMSWSRHLPKWTVIVEGQEFPARPLVLDAAGALPNDPTNSHQAVAILQARGFEVRYAGRPVTETCQKQAPPPIADLVRSLRGRYQGTPSLVEVREREHRVEKDRFAR
jgi:hypothetical protein